MIWVRSTCLVWLSAPVFLRAGGSGPGELPSATRGPARLCPGPLPKARVAGAKPPKKIYDTEHIDLRKYERGLEVPKPTAAVCRLLLRSWSALQWQWPVQADSEPNAALAAGA